MRIPVSKFFSSGAILVAFGCLIGSCGNTRHLTYLQGSFDTARLSQIEYTEPIIRKGDILSIVIYSDNPSATAIFNQQQTGTSANPGATPGSPSSSGISSGQSGGGSTGGGATSSGGYMVDEKGNIEFQQLGVIHADSMTRSELKDTIETRLKAYLGHPYCTIRFLNYKFTMLGEVTRPGVFSIPGEHLTLFEALGLGGDLTFFGRRDNVLVIRENENKREFARLDLTKPEVMGSPYFYIKPNDVIYVEASKKKIAANNQTTIRNLTIVTSVISTVAILLALFK
jgi:polysaccharide export outer membrane protein